MKRKSNCKRRGKVTQPSAPWRDPWPPLNLMGLVDVSSLDEEQAANYKHVSDGWALGILIGFLCGKGLSKGGMLVRHAHPNRAERRRRNATLRTRDLEKVLRQIHRS